MADVAIVRGRVGQAVAVGWRKMWENRSCAGAHGQPAVQHMDKLLVNHVVDSALAGSHLRCAFEPGPSHGGRALRAYWTRSILIHAWLSVRSVHMAHTLAHTPPARRVPPTTERRPGCGGRARHRIEEAGRGPAGEKTGGAEEGR